MTRRHMLHILGGFGLLGTLLAVVRGGLQFLLPPVHRAHTRILVAGPSSRFTPGTLTFLPEGPAFIGHDETGLYALSAICPHLGCTVARQGEILACPCHGSRFALDGAKLRGPAPRPLPRLPLTITSEGILQITVHS